VAAKTSDFPFFRWACVLGPGLLIYFVPFGTFTDPQRHLLAFFAATILALILRPAAMGVTVLVSMTLIALTGTLTLPQALSGFASPTVWLIFSAFLFAQAVTETRLGLRMAYALIAAMGRTPLLLGYSLAISNLVLSPFVPSDTARGGIVAPVLRNVAQVLGSEPGPTAGRIGAYLTAVGFHTNYLASVMLLTAMAGNPLIAKFAYDIAGVEMTWARWALATSLPGLCAFALIPWLLHHLLPPQIQETVHARAFAREKLHAMGPLSRSEVLLMLVLVTVLAAWLSAPWHGANATVVAMAGVCALLLLRVLTWEHALGNRRAWEVLVWFAPLLMMADELSREGVIDAIFAHGFRHLQGWTWPFALAVMVLVYFYAHYGFASLTAQISALYPGFLAAALAVGIAPSLAAWTFAMLSNLNAGLTHYSTGSAPVYFASGYIPQNAWWNLGFVISVVNLALWMGIGPLWWSWIGLW
jgi:DASS family divalent anion:Na+ symporter